MGLKISVDDKYFKANSIDNGRLIKSFFSDLTRTIYNSSYQYYLHHLALTDNPELPLLHNEQNNYSMFSASLSKLTPVHQSEWPFSKNESYEDTSLEQSRRVDFWCLMKHSENTTLNYFIELKKGYYCTSVSSADDITSNLKSTINDLIRQLREMPTENWGGHSDVKLGVLIIHGYKNENSEQGYDTSNLRESIMAEIDEHRLITEDIHLISSNWIPPQHLEVQWEKSDLSFISTFGIVIQSSSN